MNLFNLLKSLLNVILGNSQSDFTNEEPVDIQLSLDDFKAEGIDLDQLIKVRPLINKKRLV